MPYKNPEDKKKQRARWYARVKNKKSFKANNRARQKIWLDKNPEIRERRKKQWREYKQRQGCYEFDKKYHDQRYKKRKKLRRIAEACEVWAINQRFGEERRLKDYLLKQMAVARKAKYLRCSHDIRLNWLRKETFFAMSSAAA